MGDDFSSDSLFQPIAESGGNTFPLIARMDIQPIEVSRTGYVSEPDYCVFIDCYQNVMFLKGLLPFVSVSRACCPNRQLFLRIVFCIGNMNGLIEKFSQRFAI